VGDAYAARTAQLRTAAVRSITAMSSTHLADFDWRVNVRCACVVTHGAGRRRLTGVACGGYALAGLVEQQPRDAAPADAPAHTHAGRRRRQRAAGARRAHRDRARDTAGQPGQAESRMPTRGPQLPPLLLTSVRAYVWCMRRRGWTSRCDACTNTSSLFVRIVQLNVELIEVASMFERSFGRLASRGTM
jgi:hypothetical protein